VSLAPPAVVREKALAAGAARWLDDLPELVGGLERDWSIRVGRPYQDATEAFVARASLGDGTPGVLKVMVPQESGAAGHEITALRLAGGEGCVRLLRADEALLARMREQYRYILVDEFQDTNIAQLELLWLLAGDRRNISRWATTIRRSTASAVRRSAVSRFSWKSSAGWAALCREGQRKSISYRFRKTTGHRNESCAWRGRRSCTTRSLRCCLQRN